MIGTWLICTSDIADSNVWHEICVTWSRHRRSNKFARLNHHFPVSVEGFVLSMDTRIICFSFPFYESRGFLLKIDSRCFFLGNSGARFSVLTFEFSRLPRIERCVDYCLWSTTGHFVEFVNRIRWNTLWMSTLYNCVPTVNALTIETQRYGKIQRQETQRHRDTKT